MVVIEAWIWDFNSNWRSALNLAVASLRATSSFSCLSERAWSWSLKESDNLAWESLSSEMRRLKSEYFLLTEPRSMETRISFLTDSTLRERSLIYLLKPSIMSSSSPFLLRRPESFPSKEMDQPPEISPICFSSWTLSEAIWALSCAEISSPRILWPSMTAWMSFW